MCEAEPFLALVRFLEADNCNTCITSNLDATINDVDKDGSIEVRYLEQEEISLANEEEWNKRTISLFLNHGCQRLKWSFKEDGTILHTIIRVSAISRPVSIIPDFEAPVRMEPGDKRWKEETAKAVERDLKRYRKEMNGSVNKSEVAPPRSADDGPENQPEFIQERFFYNPFMIWTSPSV